MDAWHGPNEGPPMMASPNQSIIRSDRPAINCTSWSSSAPLPHLDIGNGSTSKPQDLFEARPVPSFSAGVTPGHRGPVPDPFRHQDRVSNYLVTLPFFSFKDSSLTVQFTQICHFLEKLAARRYVIVDRRLRSLRLR